MSSNQKTSTGHSGLEGCELAELANACIAGRQAAKGLPIYDRFLSEISEQGLHRLINIAYYTSLLQEEGRFPKLQIHVGASGPGPGVVEFGAEVEPLRIETLRKLAPAVYSKTSAIEVVERGGELFCPGVRSRTVPWKSWEFDADMIAEDHARLVGGLQVWIDGPGELRVAEGPFTFHLRAGHIERLYPVCGIPSVKKFLDGVVEWKRDSGAKEFESRVLEGVWERVLCNVVEKRHGGAIVIPSEWPSNWIPQYTECVEPDLGACFRQVAEAQCLMTGIWHHAGELPAQSVLLEVEKAAAARHGLRVAIDAAADLANVDGCVIVSPEMKVCGFGGKIQAQDAAKPVLCSKVYECDAASAREFDLDGRGTRHRSAAMLCQQLPGTIVFVVSQDGDLRVFSSAEDTENVWVFENLTTHARMGALS